MLAKASSSDFLLTGFLRKAKAPSFIPRCQLSSTEMTWTGMWRVHRVVLEAVEDDPAVHVGQPQVERDGVRPDLVGQLQGRSRRTR